MQNIKEIPTVHLVNQLCEETNQKVINEIAYELAYRIYVPNNRAETFEEMLEKFGYRPIEKENNLQKKRK